MNNPPLLNPANRHVCRRRTKQMEKAGRSPAQQCSPAVTEVAWPTSGWRYSRGSLLVVVGAGIGAAAAGQSTCRGSWKPSQRRPT